MRAPALLLITALAIAGCSRSVATTFPPSSAASLEAEEGRAARVGRAIEEEPPLPGERREGWEALEQGESAPVDHSGHGGHGHAH